jgi:hypothetical protein
MLPRLGEQPVRVTSVRAVRRYAGAVVGVGVGVAVGIALVALVVILIGPSRAVRAETGMDQEAETRVLLTYYPEGVAEDAMPPAPPSPAVQPTFDTAQIRALRDLDDPSATD